MKVTYSDSYHLKKVYVLSLVMIRQLLIYDIDLNPDI